MLLQRRVKRTYRKSRKPGAATSAGRLRCAQSAAAPALCASPHGFAQDSLTNGTTPHRHHPLSLNCTGAARLLGSAPAAIDNKEIPDENTGRKLLGVVVALVALGSALPASAEGRRGDDRQDSRREWRDNRSDRHAQAPRSRTVVRERWSSAAGRRRPTGMTVTAMFTVQPTL